MSVGDRWISSSARPTAARRSNSVSTTVTTVSTGEPWCAAASRMAISMRALPSQYAPSPENGNRAAMVRAGTTNDPYNPYTDNP